MLPRALTSPELANIRLDGQWVEVLACFPQPATVYTAQVNGTPAGTDKLTQITYDGGSGTLANVLPGMTVLIGTTPGGWDVGQARIRKTPTSTILYIGTASELNVTDDQYLTVIDEFGLWQKRVRVDSGSGIIYMDEDVAYSNQHTNRLPVVLMGGPAVLELGDSAAVVVAHFDASGSWVPGGGSATYLWAAPGAVSTTSTTAATFDASYNAAGRYRVSCTVTIGGVANTRYEYVQVFDPSTLPVTQFQLKQLTGNKQTGGWSWQMTLYAQADLATVRDRGQVILFTRDHYGTAGKLSQGYATGRENILCVGWIVGQTIQWSPELSSVTFQVEGTYSWLGKITAYPQGLDDVTTTPSKWTDYNTLTPTGYLWHLFTWRSTVAQAVDCIVEQSSTRVIELAAAAANLWEQLNVTTGQRLMAPAASDHLARLFVLIDAQFRSDRSGVVNVMTLTKADWIKVIQLTRITVPPVGMVDLNGFQWDGTTATALFSLSPGRVWKRYGRVVSQQAMLLTDQSQSNTLAGLISGQANCEYPQVTIQLAGNNRFFDIAPDSYALLTLAAGDTPRGVSFTSRRFLPRRITYAWDQNSGGLLPTIDFESETFAELAVTGDGPATAPIGPPPPPCTDCCPTGYVWDPTTSTCVPTGTGAGDGNTVFAVTYNKVGRTRNFLDASPHWVDLTTITPSGNIVDFALDAYDPVNYGYVLTTTHLYLLSNLNTDTPTWTSIYVLADVGLGGRTVNAFEKLACTIAINGGLWVSWECVDVGGATPGAPGSGVSFLVVNKAGASIDPTSGAATQAYKDTSGAGAYSQTMRMVQNFASTWDPVHNVGAMYLYALYNGGTVLAYYSYFCYWSGINWEFIPGSAETLIYTFPAFSHPIDCDGDFEGSNLLQYLTYLSSGTLHIMRSTDGGSHFNEVKDYLTTGAVATGHVGWQYTVNIATHNSNDVLVCMPEHSNEGGNYNFFRSTDGGATWANIHSGPTTDSPIVTAVGRWPYDGNRVFFLTNGGGSGVAPAPAVKIGYSPDGFATAPREKIGDWESGSLGTWHSANMPVMIVPVWLAT